MQWMNTGSDRKTADEVNRLVADVLTSPDFRPEQLGRFNAQKENECFDRSEAGEPSEKDGWKKVEIDIPIPSGHKNSTGIHPNFKVPDFHFRSLIEVIKSAFSEPTAFKFHLSPFKKFVNLPDGTNSRIYDEAFSSDAYLQAHNDLQKQPNEPGCDLEKVVASLMFFSDATHLTNFGTAKAWPVYLYFGNSSKYERAKPNSGACHHIAYIPTVRVC